jgi:hypothetical protein
MAKADEQTTETNQQQTRRSWQRPTLKAAGTVSDVLQGGTGKVTVVVGDPGESQKVPSMDM